MHIGVGLSQTVCPVGLIGDGLLAGKLDDVFSSSSKLNVDFSRSSGNFKGIDASLPPAHMLAIEVAIGWALEQGHKLNIILGRKILIFTFRMHFEVKLRLQSAFV